MLDMSGSFARMEHKQMGSRNTNHAHEAGSSLANRLEANPDTPQIIGLYRYAFACAQP